MHETAPAGSTFRWRSAVSAVVISQHSRDLRCSHRVVRHAHLGARLCWGFRKQRLHDAAARLLTDINSSAPSVLPAGVCDPLAVESA
jgi:hypothetical protein